MPKINPEILIWARETAGLNLDEACKKLGLKDTKKISAQAKLFALEAGAIEPDRSLLLKMSQQYHRPLLVFYMSNPPKVEKRGEDFRTLPQITPQTSLALVDALIRNIQVRQRIIREALEDEEATEKIPLVNSLNRASTVDVAAKTLINKINFDIETFRKQSSVEDAFKYLRKQIESAGVFVLLIGDLGSHHTAIDLQVFRGFSLSDEIAPFIVINDKDSQTAWSFTLLHELTHIGLGQTGISGQDSELKIEKFCNEVAAKILMENIDLAFLRIAPGQNFEFNKQLISDFASDHKISSTMLAYNLYLQNKISKNYWQRLQQEYRENWLTAKAEKKENLKGKQGPSYYVVRRHRLGENIISTVHRMVLSGSLTTVKAGRVLGISPKNLQRLVDA